MNLGLLGRVENLKIINFFWNGESIFPQHEHKSSPTKYCWCQKLGQNIIHPQKKLSWDIFRSCDLKILK